MEDNRTAVPESPGDTTSGTPIPGTAGSPTPTHYSQLANAIIAQLQAIVELIPGYEPEHELTSEFVKRKLRLPTDFVQKALSALLVLPELQGVPQLNADTSLDDLQFVQAFEAVASLLAAFAKALRYTIDVKKARLAANAQQIYQVAKGLALDRNGAAIRTHLEEMKKARTPQRRTTRRKPGVPIFAAAA